MQIDFSRYAEAGLHIIPVSGKLPHWDSLPKNDEGKPTWIPLSERLPTEEELEAWQKSDATGVAVFTGEKSGIIALDNDCYREYPEIKKYIPDSPVVRIGKQPKWMRLYKYNPELSKTEKLPLENGDLIELLSNGRYFVADGMHPDTGKPYFYIDEHLLDIDKEDLPEFPLKHWNAIKQMAKRYAKQNDFRGLSNGGRHDSLVQYTGQLISLGMDKETIVQRLLRRDAQFDESYFKTHKNTPEKMVESLSKSDERSKRRKVDAIKRTLPPAASQKSSSNEDKIGEAPVGGGAGSGEGQELPFFFEITKRGLSPNYLMMANYLRDECKLVITNEGNYVYNGTHYEQLTALGLDHKVYKLTQGMGTPAQIEGFKKLARVQCYNKDFFLEQPPGHMNLANGLLNVRTHKLTPHAPEQRQTSVLPIEYDPKAKCPQWDKFLNQVFMADAELIQLMSEIFGYTLLGGDPFLQKAFCLYGTGRNGKSTLLYVLKSLIGRNNYSAVPMNLLHKGFSTVMLDKRIANICEETPSDTINAEIFKTAVGGGAIVASQKGQPEFLMEVQARFIFACNGLPVFKDRTKGLEDRLVFIPFELYLKDEDRDFEINKKLGSELPGILNWALKGAENLLDWGRLTIPGRTLTLKDEYKRESDSVYDYFKEFLEISKDVSDAIPIKETYMNYVDWCKSDGRFAVSQRTFTKGIKAHGLDEIQVKLSDSSVGIGVFKETTRSFGFGKYGHAIPHFKKKQ